MDGLYCKLLVIILLCLFPATVGAQEVFNMVSDSTIEVNTCLHPIGYLFDDGGQTGDYSNNFDGYVILSAPVGVTITVSGSYYTESCCDYLKCYDGYGSVASVLLGDLRGNGTMTVSSSSGYLTLHFHSDFSIFHSGFELSYSVGGTGSLCSNMPSNIVVGNVTTTSAQVSWSADTASGRFMLSLNDGTPVVSNGNSYTFTGLAPGSVYEVRVSSLADSLSHCCREQKYFRTTCNVISRADLPYHYGFEDATGTAASSSIDTCWTRITKSPFVTLCPSVMDANTGLYSMNMSIANGNDYAYLVMPEYVDTLGLTQVRFALRNRTVGSSGRVEVGVMSDPFDTNTFVRVGAVHNRDMTFETRVMPLNGYAAGGGYVAFRVRGGGCDVLLDDVVLELMPECSQLGSVRVENVSVSSLAVSWDLAAHGSSATVGYEVTVVPALGGTPVSTTVSHSPAIVTGLSAMTDYWVRVRPICTGNTYGNWDSVAVRTMCTGYSMSSMSGTGNNTVTGVPVYYGYGNTVSQSIYTVADLTAMGIGAGIISSIRYDWTENSTYAKQLEVYLGTTSQSSYGSNTFIASNLTHVYSGAHPLGTSGVQTYAFSTPFYWDGVSNLVVTTIMNQPPGVSQIFSYFYGHSTYSGGAVQTLYKYRDNTPFSIADLPNLTSIYNSQYRPNISFSACDSTLTQCFGPMIVVDSVGYNDVTLSWAPGGAETEWEVAYRPVGGGTWNVVATHYTGTSYHFVGLGRSTEYEFRVTAPCGTTTAQSVVVLMTLCHQTSFNYDDLYGDNVVCRYGTYSNPDMGVGVVDFGSASNLSRHTVHYDRSETDYYTGGQLYTVPEGYCTSVRLGNWSTGSEAESITYTLNVDTADYDMLLLKYAAVLEDPNHTPDEQPRFTFLITDVNGDTISPCYNADFIANSNLGWNTGSRYDILWKDWTTVGVDLSPMHGQNIRIKLTSYDCDQSGHFGYAYFVIDLDNKALRSNSCSSDENTFYAPSGFSYNWYSSLQPNITLSTADSLQVTAEGTYYCDLSFVGAPNDDAHSNCFFTMMAHSGVRYPFARFTVVPIDTSSCRFSWMRMVNQSIITRDSAHLDSMANGCESYLWYFDDGTTSSDINPRHSFTPGIHTVTLYAMLADGQCSDSVSQTFLIESPCMVYDTVTLTLCEGQVYNVFDTTLATAGEYLIDSLGVSDSLFIRTVYLTVNPRSFDTVVQSVCESYLWPLTGTRYSLTGLYNDTLVNAYGCDSIVTLDITVYPTYDVHIYDTVCQTALETGYTWGNTVIHAADIPTGVLTNNLHTSSPLQCDSLVTLHLAVLPVVYGDTFAVACDSFAWYGTLYNSGSTVTDTLSARYTSLLGCDSAVVLHLTLHSSTQFTYYDTCSENGLPRYFHGITVYGDTMATVTETNAAGCDSIITYRLTVLGNSRASFDTTFCANQLPIQWYHRLFTGPGTQYDTIENHLGADSILTLTLHVSPVSADTLPAVICYGQSYLFEGTSYTNSGMYTHTLQNQYGCDSLRTLHLVVNQNTASTETATACDSYTWHDSTYTVSTNIAHFLTTNAQGCDSVVTLHLTVNHSSTATESVIACDSYTWHDSTYTASTLNSQFSTLNSAGCDSTVTLHLTITNSISTTENITACDSYTWHGTTYTASTTDSFTTVSSQGCDSTVTLNLTINYSNSATETVAACDSYTWHGSTYTSSTSNAQFITLNSMGCDSTVTLNLTINNSTSATENVTSCDTYSWHGSIYSTSSIDSITLTNAVGCDSTVTLHLTVNHSTFATETDTACNSYTWHDSTYTASTSTAQYSTLNSAGCDSTVTLHLTIYHNSSSTVFDTIVENLASTWQYHGIAVPHDTVGMSVVIPDHHGCDSIINYNLHIWPNAAYTYDSSICENTVATFTWHGYSYADTLHWQLLTVHGADSLVTLAVHLLPVYSIDIYDTVCRNILEDGYTWGDTLIHYDNIDTVAYTRSLLTQTLCDSIVTLHLVINPDYNLSFYDTVYYGDNVLFEGLVCTEPGVYVVRHETAEGCDSLHTLYLAGRNMVSVTCTDTLCQGDTLLFGHHVISSPGTYTDTIVSGDFTIADTLLTLNVVVVPYPVIDFDTAVVCGSDAYYTVTAVTDASYLRWSSSPYDPSLIGQESASVIQVSPAVSTLYTLEADYRSRPQCRVSDTLRIAPIDNIAAVIEIRPPFITLDDRSLTAYNRSHGHYSAYKWYILYDNNAPITVDEAVLSLIVPHSVDSVAIALSVSNFHCADTDTVRIDILHSGILFPNVFTPSKETNNIFRCMSTGVHNFELWIYDRRGALVFHTTDIEEGWDGTSGGRPCRQETYVYRCRYSNEEIPDGYQSYTGTVTLIR